MSNLKNNWTKEELKTYILIYCANADFSEQKLELDFIKSKVQTDNFDKIHAEFKKDNDYNSIQKIMSSAKEHGYTSDEKELLFKEIKELFLSDEKFDVLERNLLFGLNKLLK